LIWVVFTISSPVEASKLTGSFTFNIAGPLNTELGSTKLSSTDFPSLTELNILMMLSKSLFLT
jgi:hypothetical protein